MTRFEYINENIERIKFDVRIGLIPPSVLKHFAIYSRFDYYKRVGNKYSDAIICVQGDYAVSEQWLCMIVRNMEAQI
jgi:hypothetical protein